MAAVERALRYGVDEAERRGDTGRATTTAGAGTPAAAPASAPADSAGKPKEVEGVFIVRNGIATFHPVKVGIAGAEYFEVVSGLQLGDTIVAGTYQAIRDLKDSSRVRAAQGGPQGSAGGN